MEKNVRIGWLLDFYGEFLTEKQRNLLEMHVNDDLSLAEIAERTGITRQGVHDALRRGSATLEDCESRLGLLERTRTMQEGLSLTLSFLEGRTSLDSKEVNELRARLLALSAAWEDTNGL